MKRSERRFFSGNSLAQAVTSAARYYQIEPEELAYERVEKRHGFLKTRRRVVIEVDAQALTKQPEPPPDAWHGAPPQDPYPRSRHRAELPDRSRPDQGRGRQFVTLPGEPRRLRDRFPRAQGKVAEVAQEGLDCLRRTANLELSWRVLQGDGRLEIELWGPDRSRLTAHDGYLLLSWQHLLPRMLRAALGESVPCRIDCDNFLEIREERLRDLAQQVAAEVRRREQPKTLRSMNPTDRRIVHLALADDPAVVTESTGEGYFKRITVRPA